MKYSDQETPKAIQHNIMQLTQDSHFLKKNKLPQAGLEPMTVCVLGSAHVQLSKMCIDLASQVNKAVL